VYTVQRRSFGVVDYEYEQRTFAFTATTFSVSQKKCHTKLGYFLTMTDTDAHQTPGDPTDMGGEGVTPPPPPRNLNALHVYKLVLEPLVLKRCAEIVQQLIANTAHSGPYAIYRVDRTTIGLKGHSELQSHLRDMGYDISYHKASETGDFTNTRATPDDADYLRVYL